MPRVGSALRTPRQIASMFRLNVDAWIKWLGYFEDSASDGNYAVSQEFSEIRFLVFELARSDLR